ncbi:hypothetical protein ABH927_000861 [Planotetraspora sp. GP83]
MTVELPAGSDVQGTSPMADFTCEGRLRDCRPVRWFAEYQPFTPLIETLPGLLMGTPIGNSGIIALAWCAGLTLAGYLWRGRPSRTWGHADQHSGQKVTGSLSSVDPAAPEKGNRE